MGKPQDLRRSTLEEIRKGKHIEKIFFENVYTASSASKNIFTTVYQFEKHNLSHFKARKKNHLVAIKLLP